MSIMDRAAFVCRFCLTFLEGAGYNMTQKGARDDRL